MKNIILTTVLVCLVITSKSQSVKGLNVFCTDKFNSKASITVQALPYDKLLVVDALKNNLVEQGFKIISEKVAKEKIELSNQGKTTDSTFKQEIEIGKSTYMKSVYVVTLNYKTDIYDILTDLQGQIVDLAADGEIVATFSYLKKGYPKKALIITKAIAEYLKSKAK